MPDAQRDISTSWNLWLKNSQELTKDLNYVMLIKAIDTWLTINEDEMTKMVLALEEPEEDLIMKFLDYGLNNYLGEYHPHDS